MGNRVCVTGGRQASRRLPGKFPMWARAVGQAGECRAVGQAGECRAVGQAGECRAVGQAGECRAAKQAGAGKVGMAARQAGYGKAGKAARQAGYGKVGMAARQAGYGKASKVGKAPFALVFVLAFALALAVAAQGVIAAGVPPGCNRLAAVRGVDSGAAPAKPKADATAGSKASAATASLKAGATASPKAGATASPKAGATASPKAGATASAKASAATASPKASVSAPSPASDSTLKAKTQRTLELESELASLKAAEKDIKDQIKEATINRSKLLAAKRAELKDARRLRDDPLKAEQAKAKAEKKRLTGILQGLRKALSAAKRLKDPVAIAAAEAGVALGVIALANVKSYCDELGDKLSQSYKNYKTLYDELGAADKRLKERVLAKADAEKVRLKTLAAGYKAVYEEFRTALRGKDFRRAEALAKEAVGAQTRINAAQGVLLQCLVEFKTQFFAEIVNRKIPA